jgi:hypothetical protein
MVNENDATPDIGIYTQAQYVEPLFHIMRLQVSGQKIIVFLVIML